jgi:hypothetical protein
MKIHEKESFLLKNMKQCCHKLKIRGILDSEGRFEVEHGLKTESLIQGEPIERTQAPLSLPQRTLVTNYFMSQTQGFIRSSLDTSSVSSSRTSKWSSLGSSMSINSSTQSSSKCNWPPSIDNNYSGFCKGAYKLCIGIGSFKVRSEPIGYNYMVSRWQCSGCYFTMPLSKSGDRYDPRYSQEAFVHKSTDIRYRWLFLAKSHLKCKRQVSVGDTGSSVSFGCIFCCNEG